jgi:transmembrane sensor
MLNKEFHIAGLIKKQLNDELDDRSSDQLQQWLSEHPSNPEFYTTLTNADNFHKKLVEFESAKSEELWKLTQAKVVNAQQATLNPKPVIVKFRVFKLIAAAAIAAFVISVGIWFFKESRNKNLDRIVYASDVAAGHQGATLTLANGNKIRLNKAANGVLATEAGVTISKTATGQLIYNIKGDPGDNRLNTLSTERGETYRVQLPDGSEVWLNAASSLTYATNLIVGGKRVVKLVGEGYFQVAKDKGHPFLVQTGAHEVQVLGTHFNINSYGNEPAIATTLLEGAVQVSYLSKKEILRPGQQAKLDSKGDFMITQVDTNPYVAWKNSQFSFENENIQTIMRMVERWYDVKVEYRGALSEEKFWGGVSRSDNVSKVLSALESTGKVYFDIKGKTIYVFKNKR